MTTAWCYTINIWPCVCVLYIYFLYIWFYFNCDECIWFLVHLLKVILMKSTVQEEKKVDWNICLIWWWWSSDTLFAWLYFFKKSCWMLAPSFWTGIWWISKEKKVKFAPPPFFWLLYFVIWTVHPHSIDVITHCMRLQPTTSVIFLFFSQISITKLWTTLVHGTTSLYPPGSIITVHLLKVLRTAPSLFLCMLV